MLPNILAAGTGHNAIVPVLSLIVSVVAVVIAVSAARFTWLQKQTEMRRALRNQMSDAVSRTYIAEKELLDIEAELHLLPRGEVEKKRIYLRSKRIVIRDQCYLVTHQAAYVLQESLGRKKLHSMCMTERKTLLEKLLKEFRFSHVEYAAIARGLDMGGDPQAPVYWNLVLEASSDLAQALYRREYSKFLFSTNDLIEGRKQFQETVDSLNALNSLVGNTDRYLWELMWTYFEWARQEKKKASERKNADTQFRLAVEIIGKFHSKEKKSAAWEIVKEQWTIIFPGEDLPKKFSQDMTLT